MITKQYNLYLFDELSESQKERAIENNRDINIMDEWFQNDIIQDATEKLQRQGFQDAKINYTGFYSQGDGASFSANVDLEQFLKGRRVATKYAKELKDDELNISITNKGHYSHEYMMSLDVDGDISDELEAFILEEAREQARSIYSDLKKTYESLQEDEVVADTLQVNEYYFNDAGKIEIA